jgi:hypothetical protein
VPGSPAGRDLARPRWPVVALLVGWALVLVVAGVWSAHHGPATVRGQSGLEQGRQTLDRAVESVIAAAGPGVTSEVHDYQVREGCRLTLARGGTTVDRVVVFTVPAGYELRLLDRLAERLPAQWRSQYFRGAGRLVADAGDFVSVTAEFADPGQVRLLVSTGCRPGTDLAVTGAGAPPDQ